MYNEERKRKYLDDKRKATTYGVSIFETTSKYEEKLGKDVCMFSSDEVSKMANESFGMRESSVMTAISYIKTYSSWCSANGFETSDGINHTNLNAVNKIRIGMVSSPKHLERVLDDAYDPVEMETLACIPRCFLWMAFSGIDAKDAPNVTVDEVDFYNMAISHDGAAYELYKESIPAFRNACNLDSFNYFHPNYTKVIRRERADNIYLMRAIKTDVLDLRTLRTMINKGLCKIAPGMSYKRIALSGIFYRAYELERAGYAPSFKDAVEHRILNSSQEYSKNYTRNKYANAIEREFFTDYENWKNAFK